MRMRDTSIAGRTRRWLYTFTPSDVWFVAGVAYLAGSVLGLELALT